MGLSRPPILSRVAALVAIGLIGLTVVKLRGEDVLLQVDTAYVTQDEGGGWSIGNNLIKYTLTRTNAGIGVGAITDATTGRDWHRGGDPDSFVTVNGQRVVIGSSQTQFQSAAVEELWGGVKLDLIYRIPSAAMDVTRSYAVYPGGAAVETWTTFQNGSRSSTLSEMTNFSFTVDYGNVRWIRGLDIPNEDGGPFTMSSGDIDDGQTLELGSDRRASEHDVPWMSVSAWSSDDEAAQPTTVGQSTQLFGAMLWGGSWRARARRQGSSLTLQMGLPSFTTNLGAGASLESPHAVFGATNELLPTASIALQGLVEHGIRHGRPLRSLATYNTAFSFGINIDEPSLRAEMELAAQAGFEQFVVDAGWWTEPNAENSGDFEHGWGNWTVDPDRFPSGLGALTDYAHELGMRFGVWVEPERVDRSTIGQDGMAKERFLATEDGRYVPGMADSDSISGQICLADSEARQWVLDKLYAFLDDVHPDYVKWDNNLWVNCNRPNHGHGTGDGNFQHIRALKDVFAKLRDRYPDMDFEDCSGGGHRMSLDALSYSDASWVDDRSAPSKRVRHNLEGLSLIFPPGYLSQFAMGADGELMEESTTNDFALILRSRMLGLFGLSSRISDMSEGTRTKLANEVALYKLLRPTLRDGSSILLGQQVMDFPDAPWSGWDALQALVPSSGEAVLFAFRTPDSVSTALVKPRGLKPTLTYDVESADFGLLGTMNGAQIMGNGLEIVASDVSQSHVIRFRIHKD